MRKVYIYSKEEEEQIDRGLGYTQEDYDNYPYRDDFHNKYGEQQQFRISIASIKKAIYYLFHRRCLECDEKLERVKELKYIGFRHRAGATGGNYQKAYKVTYVRECPKCLKRY